MGRPPSIGILVYLAAALTLAACADSEPPQSSGEPIVTDDTPVVLAGDPVWGDAVELIEEMSFGVLEGDPEYEFGWYLELAVDGSGGMYVFDGQVPVLRYYDASGHYVRTLGRGGSGPGEYGDEAAGMVVRESDGRVVVMDARNARLNLYNVDGSFHASWPVEGGYFTTRTVIRDTADHLYLNMLTGPIVAGEDWPIGLVHLDVEGQIVDTLSPPTVPGQPPRPAGPLDPALVWELSPLGGFWFGVSDEYVLQYRRPDGTGFRVMRDVERISLQREERSELVAWTEWMARSYGEEVASIPNEKPFYRSLMAGEDGRLWVRLFVAAEKGETTGGSATPGREPRPVTSWREPIVYDVFESDGTYLGQVRLPPRTTLSVHRGEHMWGVRRDELGTSSVVRFRIVAGG